MFEDEILTKTLNLRNLLDTLKSTLRLDLDTSDQIHICRKQVLCLTEPALDVEHPHAKRTAESSSAQGWKLGIGNKIFRILNTVDQGHDDAMRTGVQRPLNHPVDVGRYPYDWRDAAGGDCCDGLVHLVVYIGQGS